MKTVSKLAFFSLMGCLLLAFQQGGPPRLKVFLLIGQSNMAGRGVPEIADQQTHPRIWMLTSDQTWTLARDPMHFDKPAVIGVGPGFSFAKRLADTYPKLNIGLVPCAVGGSGIDVWKPGAYYEPTNSHPYDDALRRAKKALENGELAGFLWHQGESDSKPELTAAYGQKLAELVQRFRTDLNAPDVPFVVGTLGDFIVSRNPDAGAINQTLQNATKRIPNSYCVLATGLTHKGDSTHFDTPSARSLGQRYADVFIQHKLLKTNP
ncbi:sialate O-acetylesterase [Larkinella insperata]|uniref:Sialate O-acetylesterase n=1 Tax=Larkinella insperata TaxID=332158 RepID=A0ABW3QIE6_9BACT|nr:sialate O-acetylesterase [Larkinella insperata]